MSIFGTSWISLSLQYQSSILLSTSYRSRIENCGTKIDPPPRFKVGDAVEDHVQVQSKLDTGEVAKLTYRSRGPFQIKTVLGNNSYEIQHYNDPTSGIRKYKGSELYLLSPFIFHHKPIDSMDTKFLNYSNAPIVYPLHKYSNIQLYNDHSSDRTEF